MVGEVISAEAETPQCKPPEGKPNKIVAMQLTTFPNTGRGLAEISDRKHLTSREVETIDGSD
jgi:hypothetical protein